MTPHDHPPRADDDAAHDDPQLDAALATLSSRAAAQDPAAAAATLVRARAAFRRAHARAPLGRLGRWLELVEGPAWLAVVAIYLLLALRAISVIYR